MIKSEAKTDFRLPYVKEEETAASDGSSDTGDESSKRIKRGIPIKYFTEHEALRYLDLMLKIMMCSTKVLKGICMVPKFGKLNSINLGPKGNETTLGVG